MNRLNTNTSLNNSLILGKLITNSVDKQDEINCGVGDCKSCDCKGWRKDKANSDWFDSYCMCGHHYHQHK